MNKNKLIFVIIGASIFGLILFMVFSMNKSNSGETKKSSSKGDFNVWIIGDDIEGANSIIDKFKKVKTKYSNTNIKIESFTNYEDYNLALMSSIISDKAPDVFVLNNNEKDSIFTNQITGINPSLISPNDFRKKYKGVFSDDLIVDDGEGEDSKEFLKGIPVGYESLGIFYNRRYIKASELDSISSLNSVISELKETKPNIIPIGIGNGSTVINASDIVTQFFMLEDDVSKLSDLSGNKLKGSLATYLMFGDINGTNGYDSRFMELSKFGQTSLDLFSKGDTFMVVGFPSLINTIAKNGFSKSFLQAGPFPHYFSGNGKTLINYDYFVINKDTKNIDLANDFLLYLSSDIGAEDYLEGFKYYLPALLSLESDKLEDKIHDKFNVTLGDFFNSEHELSSFDKGVKTLYDKNIISILDNSSNYSEAFGKFKAEILCKSQKISTLENLSKSCEK